MCLICRPKRHQKKRTTEDVSPTGNSNQVNETKQAHKKGEIFAEIVKVVRKMGLKNKQTRKTTSNQTIDVSFRLVLNSNLKCLSSQYAVRYFCNAFYFKCFHQGAHRSSARALPLWQIYSIATVCILYSSKTERNTMAFN